MHELSLSSAVVNTAVKHAGGHRVELVSLRIGRLRQVVPETLEFYFDFVARDTVCDGARLEYEIIDARLRCKPCATEWGIEIPAFRCPTCGGSDVEVASGNEFEVESIEIGSPSATLEDGPEGHLPGAVAGRPEGDSEKEEAECIAPK
jgi:hydrogenase nickel incorporation protein HypA/HybF